MTALLIVGAVLAWLLVACGWFFVNCRDDYRKVGKVLDPAVSVSVSLAWPVVLVGVILAAPFAAVVWLFKWLMRAAEPKEMRHERRMKELEEDNARRERELGVVEAERPWDSTDYFEQLRRRYAVPPWGRPNLGQAEQDIDTVLNGRKQMTSGEAQQLADIWDRVAGNRDPLEQVRELREHILSNHELDHKDAQLCEHARCQVCRRVR